MWYNNVIYRFKNKEEAEKALALNGVLYKDHHLRVEICESEANQVDQKKAIFITNIYYGMSKNFYRESASVNEVVDFVTVVARSTTKR